MCNADGPCRGMYLMWNKSTYMSQYVSAVVMFVAIACRIDVDPSSEGYFIFSDG